MKPTYGPQEFILPTVDSFHKGGNSMKNRVMLLGLLFFLPVSVCTQEQTPQTDPCFAKATAQAELTACADQALDKADARLNEVYQQLLKKRAADIGFTKKLRIAQEAWLKFRDAHIDLIYPSSSRDQVQSEGTAYPMCKAMEITRLTVERTRTLENMLNPKEGDVCGL